MEEEQTPDTEQQGQPQCIDDWGTYFLNLAEAAARKSKDPRCQVGAVLVRDNVVLSTGFNGFARGVWDDAALDDVDEKLKLVCHAELNAVVNAARIGVSTTGATIYVTKFPCLSCCNAVAQAGIKKIFTHDDRFWDDDPLDGDHHLKRRVLKQTEMEVVAPRHPEYSDYFKATANVVGDSRRKSTKKAQESSSATPPKTAEGGGGQ